MAIKTFSVAKFMLAMGFKLPTYRDVPITSEREYDMAVWLGDQFKSFIFKPTGERVRVTYVGFRHMKLEILK